MGNIAALMSADWLPRQMTAGQIDQFASLACDGKLLQFDKLDALTTSDNAKDISVFITGWHSPIITPTVLQSCPSLQLIAHCGGTVRQVVDPSVLERGIRVTNSAAANAVPVAEFLVSWILRWNKRLPYWEAVGRKENVTTQEIGHGVLPDIGSYGKTVGIIAASNVGCRLAKLLKHFHLEVLIYDPFLSPEQAQELGGRKVELPELLTQSDIVSINAPLLPETVNMIGAEQLALMQDDALLINTARGPLVDHDALLPEVQSGRLNAVLDVTEPEPLPAGSPFRQLDNVFLTPHVAGSMGLEVHRLTDSVLGEVRRFLNGQPLMWEVTPENWETAA